MGEMSIAGAWDSHYECHEGNGANKHTVIFEPDESASGRFTGVSIPDEAGSVVTLNLSVKDNLVSGIWSEHTSSNGPYKGKVFEGLLELIVNHEVTSMTGRWLGLDVKDAGIKSGNWTFARLEK